MKNAVLYFSKTGHSKKLAEAIAAELKVVEQDIALNPEIQDVDRLFIVGGIYGGKSDPVMLDYARGIFPPKANKAFLLTSCVSKRFKQDEVRAILHRNGVDVFAEEFVCQGALAFVGRKHPDREDLENAVRFVRMIQSESDSAEKNGWEQE